MSQRLKICDLLTHYECHKMSYRHVSLRTYAREINVMQVDEMRACCYVIVTWLLYLILSALHVRKCHVL